MEGIQWWSSAFLLQMAFLMVCSNARQCTHTGSSFAVLGVFDDNNSTSIGKFQTAVGDLNKMVDLEPGCTPNITHRELLLNEHMSAIQVINATRNVFLGENICYVVYSSYGSNGQLLLDYALNSGIPVVSTIPTKVYTARDDLRSNFFDPAKVINLNRRSTPSEKVRVIVDFLFKENHKEFVAVTGADVDAMSVVSSLREVIRKRSLVMVDSFVIPSDSDVVDRTVHKMMYLQRHLTILIITNDMELADKIVTGAVYAQGDFQWILVSDRYYEVIESAHFAVHINTIYPKIRENLQTSDYVEDAIGILRVSFKEWIINPSGRCPSISEIQSHLPRVAFAGETGFVKFNNERQRVQERYEISVKSPGVPEQLPVTQRIGDFYNGNLNKDDDRGGQQIVKVTVVEYAPYVMIHPKIVTSDETCESKNALSCFKRGPGGVETNHESCCNGFVIDVIIMVRNSLCSKHQLCFSVKLIFNNDGVFGIRGKNGSWNGVVNDIITGEVDMSADLFPNSRRSEVLDFTDVYMPTGIALLVKETKRQQSKIYWTTYMRPFTSTLWYVFVGSVGVMVAFTWIVEKFGPSRTDGKLFRWKVAFCIDNAVCYVLQLAFGRPADDAKPRTHGARFTGLIFGIAMMILMASYSANLAAFLIVTDLTTPVDSIYDEKIANPPPGFKYGTIEGSYMADFFSNTDIKYFRNIWPIMKKDSVKSLSEGVNKVRSGELDVLIGDSVSLQYAALDDPYCELTVIGEPFAMSGPSFAVLKGSSRTELLSTVLRTFSGLRTFIQKSWVKKYTCQKEVIPVQLPFRDLIGLFLQLLIAIILCILGTTCNRGWNHVNQNYRKCENNDGKSEDTEETLGMSTYGFQGLKETHI